MKIIFSTCHVNVPSCFKFLSAIFRFPSHSKSKPRRPPKILKVLYYTTLHKKNINNFKIEMGFLLLGGMSRIYHIKTIL